MHLNYQNIVEVLKEAGYSPSHFISNIGLNDLLTRLNGDDPFDADILDQIWGQCHYNSLGQVQLKYVVDTVLRAKRIVVDQINESTYKIKKLEDERRQVERDLDMVRDPRLRSELYRRLAEQNIKIQYEKTKKQESNINLDILNRPFSRISISRTPSPARSVLKTKHIESVIEQDAIPVNSQEYFNDLRFVLFLSVPLVLFYAVLMFQKWDFLNLMCYCFIILTFVIVNVDKTYIRFTLTILVLSIVTDILWIYLEGQKFWDPPRSSEYSHSMDTFRKICLIVTVVLLLGKVIIGLLLARYRNIYTVLDVKWLAGETYYPQKNSRKLNVIADSLSQ